MTMTNELKPVNCGCGGEAEVHAMGHEMSKTQYYIKCKKCDTRTWFFDSETEAITVWNRAMGNRMELQTVERTAKVTSLVLTSNPPQHVLKCENCGGSIDKTYWRYCSRCGCRLDWDEDIPMEYFESGGK